MTTIRRKHCRIIPDAGSAEKLSDLSLWPGSTTLVSSGCLQGPCSSQQTGSAGSRFAPRMTIRMPILTLRDLAKHFQTTTEARAHCCFGCFRRLLWPIGDRGVCWTSNNINARCETILQVPSSICFAGEIQARTRIFLLWLCLWCSPWPQIFPSRILSMLFHFGLAQTYGKQLLLEVVFSTPTP